jgi:hypothetical protein
MAHRNVTVEALFYKKNSRKHACMISIQHSLSKFAEEKLADGIPTELETEKIVQFRSHIGT